jgi:hypothetical protein
MNRRKRSPLGFLANHFQLEHHPLASLHAERSIAFAKIHRIAKGVPTVPFESGGKCTIPRQGPTHFGEEYAG